MLGEFPLRPSHKEWQMLTTVSATGEGCYDRKFSCHLILVFTMFWNPLWKIVNLHTNFTNCMLCMCLYPPFPSKQRGSNIVHLFCCDRYFKMIIARHFNQDLIYKICFRLLKKKLFKEELEPNWPGSDKFWDWDMWMRIDSNRKGEQYCSYPASTLRLKVMNVCTFQTGPT